MLCNHKNHQLTVCVNWLFTKKSVRIKNCELFTPVWDIQTTIDGSLQSTKDSGAGSSSVETNIEDSSECFGLSVNALNTIIFTCSILLTLVNGI